MSDRQLQEMHALQDKAADLNWQKSKMKPKDFQRLEELETIWIEEQKQKFNPQHLAMFV